MMTSLFPLLATSYIVWYLEQHELAAVYPFDDSYATPIEAGAPGLQETAFATKDGERLIVWRAEPQGNLPTIFYLPGNAGNLTDRAPRFNSLIEAGYGVVALAYRGSSGSTGKPDEEVLVADARALAHGLKGTVILYGESLGAAVAIRLAVERIGHGLVLEAPFTSLPELVSAQFPTEDLRGTITQRWNSLAAVGDVEQPLLVIHGDADRIVPFAMGRAVFEAAGSQDKTFLQVRGSGHKSLWTEDVLADLFSFLARDFGN